MLSVCSCLGVFVQEPDLSTRAHCDANIHPFIHSFSRSLAFSLRLLYLPASAPVPSACAPGAKVPGAKEAVNLTMSAGRTSGCPIVHLGTRPNSNNIWLFAVWRPTVAAAPPAADLMQPPSAEKHPEKRGSPPIIIQRVRADYFNWISHNFIKNFFFFLFFCCQIGLDSTALIGPSRSPNGKASNLNDCLRRVKCHANPSLLHRNSWPAVASVQGRGRGEMERGGEGEREGGEASDWGWLRHI